MSDVRTHVARVGGNQRYGQSGPFTSNSNSYDKAIQQYQDTIDFWDDPFTNSFLGQWLFPGFQQDKEFAQQMVSMDLQNQYNDPRAEMSRLKAAGINPNLAAGGIAANGSPSASPSSVPSAVGSGAPSADGLANMANAVTGGMSSIADALFKNATRIPTVEKLKSETKKAFAEVGLTEAQTDAMLIDNKYRDDNNRVDLETKGLIQENLRMQWNNLYAQYELTSQMIDTELEKLNLLKSEEKVNDANSQYLSKMKEKTDYEAQFAKARIDFWNAHGFDILHSSVDAMLVQMLENGKDITNVVDGLGKYYDMTNESVQKSIENHAYSISQARKNGENISDVMFGRVGSWADAIGRAGQLLLGNYKTTGIFNPNDSLDSKASSVRKHIYQIIDDAYKKYDSVSDNDKIAIESLISQMNLALQLSNKELVDWYESSYNTKVIK